MKLKQQGERVCVSIPLYKNKESVYVRARDPLCISIIIYLQKKAGDLISLRLFFTFNLVSLFQRFPLNN